MYAYVRMGDSITRGPMTPYTCFVQHFCNQVYRPGGLKTIGEVKTLAEERWRGMTDGEKKPYKDLSERQARLAKAEAKAARAAAAGGSRKRKRKTPKDPNAPKRGTTAFFFFAQVERSKVKEANPEWKVTEISKELGRMWGDMVPEDKVKYEQLALKDRERYQQEMARYTAMQKSLNEGSEGYSEEEYQ